MSNKAATGRIIWSPAGYELSAQECDWLTHSASAGLILFSRNYHNPIQLKDLIAHARELAPDAIISIDQEGGAVQRLRRDFTPLPAAARISALYKKEPDKATYIAEQMGRITAMELRAYDIRINYAPVLDLDRGVSRVIGERAWGRTAQQVVSLASAYIRGLKKGGLVPVGKHFPGHGGVTVDSHIGLPRDNRSLTDIRKDMQPFIALAQQLPCLMTAHIVYEKLDKQAATFSSLWLGAQLREAIHYKGLVISDDLCMGAVTVLYRRMDAVVKAALAAGCDLLLVCHDSQRIERALRTAENVTPLSSAQCAWLQPPVPDQGSFDIVKARTMLNDLVS